MARESAALVVPRRRRYLSIQRTLAACLLCSLSLFAAPVAHADLELRWLPGESSLDQQLAAYLTDSEIITDIVLLLDTNFELTKPLTITVGSNADVDGMPTYSAEDGQIRLPYAYLEKAVRAQAELVEGTLADESGFEGRAIERAMDLVEYTVYHMVGHALVEDADVGADDLAEAVSTWLMISAWPNGAQQWVADVQAFSAASRLLDGSLTDYWHTHSLYKIRENTLNCWALGADPEGVEPMLAAVADPLERQTQCKSSWSGLNEQMRALLEPLLKPGAPILRETLD